jgi:hypothetical protein
MSSDPVADFWLKKIKAVPDEEYVLSLDPVCHFVLDRNGTHDTDVPEARAVLAWIFGPICALYLLLSIPLLLMRRKVFPLTLKSPVLALALAVGFACIQMINFWVDIVGHVNFPCRVSAVARSLFAPLSVLTFVTELFRIRSKVRYNEALTQLEAAKTPEAKVELTKELRKRKNNMGWRTDSQAMAICLTPSLLYFFLVVVPEPKMQANCVGCVSIQYLT